MIPELRMRERELKKEWIEAANWVSAEWLSVSQPQGRQNRGREAKSTKRQRDEMWGEVKAYVLAFVWNWAEVGFRYKSNGAFYTFFFFFFFWISARIVCFGRYGRFRPDSARIGPSWSRIGASRLKARGIHMARRSGTQLDAWAMASPVHRRVLPRRTRVRHLWCCIRAS